MHVLKSNIFWSGLTRARFLFPILFSSNNYKSPWCIVNCLVNYFKGIYTHRVWCFSIQWATLLTKKTYTKYVQLYIPVTIHRVHYPLYTKKKYLWNHTNVQLKYNWFTLKFYKINLKQFREGKKRRVRLHLTRVEGTYRWFLTR